VHWAGASTERPRRNRDAANGAISHINESRTYHKALGNWRGFTSQTIRQAPSSNQQLIVQRLPIRAREERDVGPVKHVLIERGASRALRNRGVRLCPDVSKSARRRGRQVAVRTNTVGRKRDRPETQRIIGNSQSASEKLGWSGQIPQRQQRPIIRAIWELPARYGVCLFCRTKCRQDR